MGFVIYLLFTYLHELNIQQPVLIDNQLNILGDASFWIYKVYKSLFVISNFTKSIFII